MLILQFQIYFSLFCISFQISAYFTFQLFCVDDTAHNIKYSDGIVKPNNPANSMKDSNYVYY